MSSTANLHGAKERWEDLKPQKREEVLSNAARTGGRFGRMFDDIAQRRALLPEAEKEQQKKAEEQLQKLGRLMGGVVRERREQVKKSGVRGGLEEKVIKEDVNDKIPAGFTFLAQFLAHDITYDPTSSLERQNDLPALHNFRTPAFELDCLYGCGPVVSPHLYDQKREGRFLLDKEFDLPRNSQGTALIGDPRNDQNLIIAQLHLAFLKFHNAIFDEAYTIKDGEPEKESESRFDKVQRLVRWHYQWIVRNEFLPLIVDEDIIKEVEEIHKNAPYKDEDKDKRLYKWREPDPFIPVEFSAAAYRFGHSQLWPVYRINDNGKVGLLPLFWDYPQRDERQDLRGGPISEDYVVNWRNFFNTGKPPKLDWDRASKKINTRLAGQVLFLPSFVVPQRPDEPRIPNLAVLDLMRGRALELPSGQEVADKVKEVMPGREDKFLTKAEIWEGEGFKDFNEQPAPLWYYILKEAEKKEAGERLGVVGGRIVAEVFIGLLYADQKSYLHSKRYDGWRPTIPATFPDKCRKAEDFCIVDLLTIAGADTE
jgi:hypothetical protein